MLELDPALTQSLNMIFPQKCIMSIFTVITPIEISKQIMDYFIFENSSSDRTIFYTNGEKCLLQLLFKMLKFVEKRCLKMDEDELFGFLKNG